MTAQEFTPMEICALLLCCDLNQRSVQTLTTSQFRQLAAQVVAAGAPDDPVRELQKADLREWGCGEDTAARILALLDRQRALKRFLTWCQLYTFRITTCVSPDYPKKLLALGQFRPPVLLYSGDVRLLDQPAVSLVGSRELTQEGLIFARRVGRLAQMENQVLVSGGAPGADSEAQFVCTEAGGRMVMFPADSLLDRVRYLRGYIQRGQMLVCAESSLSTRFSASRAHARNRLIHAAGQKVFVAQATYNVGGSWSGAKDNLRHGWSEVYVNRYGGDGCRALQLLGANVIDADYLHYYIGSRNISLLPEEHPWTDRKPAKQK